MCTFRGWGLRENLVLAEQHTGDLSSIHDVHRQADRHCPPPPPPPPSLVVRCRLRLLLAVIDSKSFPPMLAALCNVGTMVTISSCVEDGDERREAVDALRAELSKTAATLESNDTSATTAMEDLPESSAAAYTGDSDVGDSDEDFGEDNDSSDADAAGAAQ